MKKRSLYLKALLAGLSIGVVLGLSACGTDTPPEINLNEAEGLEDEGMYLEPQDDREEEQESRDEQLEPDVDDIGPEHPGFTGMTDTVHQLTHAGMFDEIYTQSGSPNLMYSPVSLDYVIGMLGAGASKDARGAIEAYLGRDLDTFTNSAAVYAASLPDSVQVSNSLFLDGEYELNPDTEAVLSNAYHAYVKALDFSSLDAVSTVDAWCEEHTNGLITHLFDDLSEMDAVVANALYFHQDWAEQIEDASVWEDDFTNGDGSVSSVQMMHFSGDGYIETEQGEGFIKYYDGGRYCFMGMLPKEDTEFNMSDLGLWEVSPSDATGQVGVCMPEFSFESSLDLNAVLQGVTANLNVLYDSESFPNFFTEDVGVAVSSVIQKTKIDVDRKGTEAAAVTGAGMVTMSALPDDEKFVEINRPFVFVIYDCEMDVTLFMGQVSSL